MIKSLRPLYHRDVGLRTVCESVSPKAITAERRSKEFVPRVLIVEFRDEVFAALRYLCECHGCDVARAECGAVVADRVNEFDPTLLLLNESTPDESGWLIASKLRLTHHRQPIWLYRVGKSQVLDAVRKEVSGVDDILDYNGVLNVLTLKLHQRLANWLDARQDPYCRIGYSTMTSTVRRGLAS